MANYHDYRTFIVSNSREIGLGFGDDENGKEYFCIAGLREKVKTETCHESDWVSLTPECCLELYLLLESNKQRFDTKENRDKLHQNLLDDLERRNPEDTE